MEEYCWVATQASGHHAAADQILVRLDYLVYIYIYKIYHMYTQFRFAPNSNYAGPSCCDLSLDIPVSASSNGLFKGLPSCLLPCNL